MSPKDAEYDPFNISVSGTESAVRLSKKLNPARVEEFRTLDLDKKASLSARNVILTPLASEIIVTWSPLQHEQPIDIPKKPALPLDLEDAIFLRRNGSNRYILTTYHNDVIVETDVRLGKNLTVRPKGIGGDERAIRDEQMVFDELKNKVITSRNFYDLQELSHEDLKITKPTHRVALDNGTYQDVSLTNDALQAASAPSSYFLRFIGLHFSSDQGARGRGNAAHFEDSGDAEPAEKAG